MAFIASVAALAVLMLRRRGPPFPLDGRSGPTEF